jgi:hypothetical protein
LKHLHRSTAVIALAARLAAFLALVLVIAGPLGAQSLDSLAAGARVRVARYVPSRMVVGTFVRADSLSLVIMPNRGPSTMTMSRSDLRRVEISCGRRPTDEAFVRGARTGALIGVGLGLVATGLAIRADRECTDCMFPATVIVVPLSVAFAGATTLVGGMIGVASREQWSRVWPPR